VMVNQQLLWCWTPTQFVKYRFTCFKPVFESTTIRLTSDPYISLSTRWIKSSSRLSSAGGRVIEPPGGSSPLFCSTSKSSITASSGFLRFRANQQAHSRWFNLAKALNRLRSFSLLIRREIHTPAQTASALHSDRQSDTVSLGPLFPVLHDLHEDFCWG